MNSLKQEYTINSPISSVWQALIDPKIIDKWGGGPAVIDDKVGTEFKLWEDEIYGKNTKVIKEKLLIQDWSDSELKIPTVVRFELTKNGDKTELILTQTNIPEDRVKDLEDGWKNYYLEPLKQYLEAK